MSRLLGWPSNLEQAHAVDPEALESAMLRDQVHILYKSPAILLVNLIITIVAAYLLRDFYQVWLVVAWVGLFVVLSARLYDSWCYWRKPQPAETAPSWALHFTVGATATGCLWGLIGSVLLLTSDPAHLAFIAFVVGGLTAGAAVINSPSPPAMMGFTAPVVVPAILALFSRADLESIAMGLVAAAGAAALSWLSHHTNGWVNSVARREIIQAALTADLENKVVAIEYRNKLLHAVSVAANSLLTASSLDEAMPEVLKTVGEAAQVDRVLLLELPRSKEAIHSLRYGWQSADAPVLLGAEPFLKVRRSAVEADPWFARLLESNPVIGLTRCMHAGAAKTLFKSLRILSILVVPVVVSRKYWGQIGFHDCKTEREWTSVEIDTLRTLADMIAGSLIREHYIEEMKDAKRIIERNPATILFRLAGEPSLSLIYVSRNVTMLGYNPAELIALPQLYKTLFHPDDEANVRRVMAKALSQGSQPGVVEFRGRKQDGSYLWFECLYTPIRDAAGRLIEFEGIMTDITQKKEAQEKIALLARTDSLTGLINRATFIDNLGQAFAAARRGASRFAVLFIDLDRFKDVNDTVGHSAGDLLLKFAAERLKSNCRKSDFVARLGGDEFAVLQTGMSDLSDATALASKFLSVLTAPYQLGDNELHVSASIGISLFTDQTARPDELLAQADLALYRAKEEGRDQYRFHSAELDREMLERVALTEDLRRALAINELELYYQPQVELSTNRITGMEALIRWNHPTRGLLKPLDFIPSMEKSGVIVALGQWVLDHACEQMSAWRNAGIAPQTIAVNLSVGQLQTAGEFVQSVTSTLTKWGLSPKDLELDVTESMLVHVTVAQNNVLDRLQQLGVKIAIDGFGTQYSSLDYLKTYHVSCVKIPRAMIEAATQLDQKNSAMVRAIIGLARELNIEVVAQGVETEAQRELFTAAPSTIKVQGFYYSAPVPARDATELLQQQQIAPKQQLRADAVTLEA
jgi:diguanylate cyclase (GGDEF)-like protein/PAS domain S-box-containing protein